MVDLIDRQAAVDICSAQYKECLRKADWCGDTVAWNIGFAIKALSTVDAVPVVHGKWIHNWDESDVGYNTYQCDNCGLNYMVDWEFEKPKYCPNCGAKMDFED